jgi:hypothetical protein
VKAEDVAMNSDLIPVCVGACLCPGTPHADGDFVYLRPKLGLAAGIAIQKLVIDANNADTPMSTADMTGVLAEGYLLHGVVDWTLSNGSAIPVNEATIREHLLSDFERAAPVADKADDLYMGPVLAPLLKRARASMGSSSATSSNGSTSAAPAGTSKRPKRLRRSSTSTIPMDDTATTSA